MGAHAAAVLGAVMRPVAATDVPAVIALYREVFRRPVTEAWYRWKVLDSPRPPGVPAAWVAARGGRVLAHYGATGLSFQLNGETVPALHGCDLMAAPEYRGRGVFGALARAAHAGWATDGVAFLLGLPTGAWGPLRERLGCRTAIPLRWLWKPLRPTAWLPRRWLRRADGPIREAADGPTRRYGRHGSVTVAPLVGTGLELDEVWRNAAPHYDALVVRDRAWIDYRYCARPDARYRLLLARRSERPVGWLAWRRVASEGRASGIIADLFTAPADRQARHALLKAAGAAARESGADDLRAYAAPRGALHGALRAAGFLSRGGGFESVVIPLAREVPPPLLNDAARWCLCGGDFDVV